jgi:hypothetical protein
MKTKTVIISAASLLFCLSGQPVFAESTPVSLQRATGPELASAVGHYARARSLLIAAVREFDQGLKNANPDVLIDSKEWRNSVLDRAEDLEKVLAPQPATTERGVSFNPDSRLLGEAFKR